jgi:SMC interacting uncharacterized protein involved in chromosome segregation
MDDDRFARLERIMETGFATLADLIRETNSRLDQTNMRLGRLESRFDHFIDTAGTETRKLRTDIDVLTTRVDRLERKTV